MKLNFLLAVRKFHTECNILKKKKKRKRKHYIGWVDTRTKICLLMTLGYFFQCGLNNFEPQATAKWPPVDLWPLKRDRQSTFSNRSMGSPTNPAKILFRAISIQINDFFDGLTLIQHIFVVSLVVHSYWLASCWLV